MKIGSYGIMFILVLSVLHGSARQLTVCPSGCGFSTIQAAVNASSPGDTVLINYEGALTESGIVIGKSLVIRGLGQLSTSVRAHERRGEGLHRLFHVTKGALVVMEHLTLLNGRETSDPTSWKGSGGAVLIDGTGTSLTMNYMSVKYCDNITQGGSGAAVTLGGSGSSLYLNNCMFDNNISNHGGAGALYIQAYSGDCLARSVNFHNNIAANGNGGAVLVEGNSVATFIDCSFTANQALNRSSGGGLYASNAQPTFNNCVFLRNMAEKDGGALCLEGGDIANSSFYFNTAVAGGAISRAMSAAQNDLYISNCTLLNNAATGSAPAGAGLHNASPTAQIHLLNTVISKSTSGTDLYSYAASGIGTNQKNTVGRARFSTGFLKFSSN